MFLLDTNVLSELMKPHPEPSVLAWVDEQLETDLYFCAISKGEIEWGIALLPEGKRKHALAEAALEMFVLFAERCLDYSCEVSPFYRDIAIASKQLGRPMSVEDMMIAAIAQANDAVLVTRNIADFDFLPNLKLVNPWV
ncbi:MAG: type II toxin-antitoxin system VapC family toxin [Thiofilum sp.]|uniref:type II toxin-antitoxin system VapC family toxin n=1 Tax=Thiofilum sp. TaxID=2212733 RepID=UPI0025E279EE|nr:type II toxin-antitoxin system VapC family toxin [Thiofilum sp.]MBK8454058.1 type II toxin-antitoxin system VapC family toxin [Thiofilum sp.]